MHATWHSDSVCINSHITKLPLPSVLSNNGNGISLPADITSVSEPLDHHVWGLLKLKCDCCRHVDRKMNVAQQRKHRQQEKQHLISSSHMNSSYANANVASEGLHGWNGDFQSKFESAASRAGTGARLVAAPTETSAHMHAYKLSVSQSGPGTAKAGETSIRVSCDGLQDMPSACPLGSKHIAMQSVYTAKTTLTCVLSVQPSPRLQNQ